MVTLFVSSILFFFEVSVNARLYPYNYNFPTIPLSCRISGCGKEAVVGRMHGPEFHKQDLGRM